MKTDVSFMNPWELPLWKVVTPSWDKGTSPITVTFVSPTSVVYTIFLDKMFKRSSFIIFFYQRGKRCGRFLVIQRLVTLLRWCRLREIRGHHPSLLGQWLWFICSDEVFMWNVIFKFYVLIWFFKTLPQFFISTIINNINMWKSNLITIENWWTSKKCVTIYTPPYFCFVSFIEMTAITSY